ncbi:hypothetical protein OIU84_010361 [Salix udensis]|uniref:Uncharacterized protein n=1 Tax=Salix udensis TaxID=889485 RepID=A0AAD6JKJ8_9ROSI|nr:hypothetical protein OIU84_010361 [Salix udensis]
MESFTQGLDPMAISAVFSPAQYIGEKCISGTDCFVLKLSADQADLADRSDSTAEMIKHVIFGYFSQRSGLLVYLEDSYLTRIQSPGNLPHVLGNHDGDKNRRLPARGGCDDRPWWPIKRDDHKDSPWTASSLPEKCRNHYPEENLD